MEAKSREQISNWILEFLLRNPDLENVAKKSLAVLPLSTGDHRLRKIVLLRTIECEITNGLVSESTLETLELIEDLDSRRGFHTGDAIIAAFAAVAFELTVRRLVGEGGRPGPKYLAALKAIWRDRFEGSEERDRKWLNGADVRRRWDELEAAIWDEGTCEKLMGLNTRNDAVLAVRDFLKEAWVLVGKVFVGLGVRLRDQAEEGKGVRVSRDENEPLDKVSNLSDLTETVKKIDSHEPSDGNEIRDKDLVLPDSDDLVVDDTPGSKDKEVQKRNAVLRNKNITTLQRRLRGPARVSDVEESDTEMDVANKVNEFSVPSPDVAKVQEALRSSSLELKKAVTDPLPEAVQVAQTVVSELAHKDSTLETRSGIQLGREPDADNNNVPGDRSGFPNLDKPSCSHQNDALQPNTSDVNLDGPSCAYQNGVSQPKNNDVNLEKPSLGDQNGVSQPDGDNVDPEKPSCSRNDDISRPTLMERNSTAHTLEWEEEDIEQTPVGNVMNVKSRLHLPSLKKRPVSPLKKYAPIKISKRRAVKRWTLLEEDTLRTGVQKFGRGNWKLILNHYRDVLEERTEVDLKDKWRNLTR